VLICISSNTSVEASTAIKGQTDASCTVKGTYKERAGETQCDAAEYVADLYDYTMQMAGIYTVSETNTLISLMLDATLLNVAIKSDSGKIWKGQAYISSINITGSMKDKTSYTVNFRGTGPLTTS